MRNTIAMLFVASAVASSLAHAAPGAVFVPAPDIRWSDVAGTPGAQIAPLQGDPGKGASHFLLKFAGGFSAPLHHHSANHFVNVVAGTLVLVVDGKEHKFGPGSYFSFSAKKQHATRCEAGPECVLAMDARGRWDVVPATRPGRP
jgi:quercetin dioxygenase-like cupin family protein